MLNSGVTATDAGALIAEVRGKTSKMTPTAASASCMAPRGTQVQQSLSVDIFFIKGLAFLISKLYPLQIHLVLYLKDRTTECVSKGLRSFLRTAASRSFNCKEIKTDVTSPRVNRKLCLM